MWSMAALAAEAAEDKPRASMIAAPRLLTVGMKLLAFHAWSLIASMIECHRRWRNGNQDTWLDCDRPIQ